MSLFEMYICDHFQITDGFALQLFRSNMAAISGSANLASFILPYVVTYILAEQHSAMLVRSYLLVFCKNNFRWFWEWNLSVKRVALNDAITEMYKKNTKLV